MVIDDNAPTMQASAAFLPALVQPLMTLIQPTLLSFPPVNGLSPHPPITSVLGAIHLGAFECLNNIFLSLSTSPSAAAASDGESGCKIWNEVWAALSVMGVQAGPGQACKQEIWQVAIGVLWGIGIIWKGSLIPQEDQIRSLLRLSEETSEPHVKVKCIGTLECLAQHPESIAANAVRQPYFIK